LAAVAQVDFITFQMKEIPETHQAFLDLQAA
jgi:hypothetical protein